MILWKDAAMADILRFLDACEAHGRAIPVELDYAGADASIGAGRGNFGSAADVGGEGPGLAGPREPGRNSVAYEARYLKHLFLRLHETSGSAEVAL